MSASLPNPPAAPASVSKDEAPVHTSKAQRLRGIGLFLLGLALIGLLDMFSRYLTTHSRIPLLEIVWVRLLVHGIVSVFLFGPLLVPALLKSNRPALQWLRSLFMVATTMANFAALKYLQLDQVIVLFFLSPLLIALLAGPVLGEYIGWKRLAAILTGFGGVLIMARPGFGGIHPAALLSLCAVLFYAFYILLTRYLAAYDNPQVTQFYTPLAGIVLLAPVMGALWVTPQGWNEWLPLLAMGFFGGLGHYLLILAHQHAPAPVLAPFIYFAFITQSLLGYFAFDEVPTLATFSGGGIIIVSGLYLLWREGQRGGEPG